MPTISHAEVEQDTGLDYDDFTNTITEVINSCNTHTQSHTYTLQYNVMGVCIYIYIYIYIYILCILS